MKVFTYVVLQILGSIAFVAMALAPFYSNNAVRILFGILAALLLIVALKMVHDVAGDMSVTELLTGEMERPGRDRP